MIGQPPSAAATHLEEQLSSISLEVSLDLYRQMREQAGGNADDGDDAPSDLLEMLATQASTIEERRADMVERIRQAWRAEDAQFPPAMIERVLAVVAEIPRERFVAPEIRDLAYLPTALNIGYGQTISHPQQAAALALGAKVGPDDVVLDVGGGSGYQAAILASLARRVISVEIIPELALAAHARLHRLGIHNVEVCIADGSLGWLYAAPFDAIVVAARVTTPPSALLNQLRPNGSLILPIGPRKGQILTAISRIGDDFHGRVLGSAHFVPLVGAEQRPGDDGSVRKIHMSSDDQALTPSATSK